MLSPPGDRRARRSRLGRIRDRGAVVVARRRTGTGEPLAEVFAESGLERVRRRLAGWSEEDLGRQSWLAASSLDLLALGDQNASAQDMEPVFHPVAERDAATRDELLDAARAVGERLEERAFRGERDASFFDFRMFGEAHWALQPAGFDLYAGLGGIVFSWPIWET